MGQIIGKKTKDDGDIEYRKRIHYDFSRTVLVTELDATTSVSTLWNALDLTTCPAVVQKFCVRDRYRRSRRKAIVTFVHRDMALNFVQVYHQVYLFNKLIRVYYLEDHIKQILGIQFALMGSEFCKYNPHYQPSENTGLTVAFSEYPQHCEEFVMKLFIQFGNIVLLKKYRRVKNPDIVVYVKFSLFAEAYSAYVAYDGQVVNGIQISISMDKNPYYYIMYLEGRHLSTSMSSSITMSTKIR